MLPSLHETESLERSSRKELVRMKESGKVFVAQHDLSVNILRILRVCDQQLFHFVAAPDTVAGRIARAAHKFKLDTAAQCVDESLHSNNKSALSPDIFVAP